MPFQTEQDIAEIASAGLNWIRLPIPFWAIDVWPGEPFLEKTAWKYIVRLLGWCRKYGIRVNLDLHTIPGSQNGASQMK
jgi:glucan 1,3-beta-glucosidase